VARSTIQDNLRRAQASGIAWPVPAELTDDILEQRLFARGGTKAGLRRRSEPDWGTLARELKRAGVSLMVLWEEYRETQSDGYGYSRFCDLFREFERRLSPVMRQHHVAGDKVDYSGERIAIVEPKERQSATSQLRHEEVQSQIIRWGPIVQRVTRACNSSGDTRLSPFRASGIQWHRAASS
jgi:transposase